MVVVNNAEQKIYITIKPLKMQELLEKKAFQYTKALSGHGALKPFSTAL